MSEVPDRGSPDTMMIASTMSGWSPRGTRPLDVDVQHAAEAQGGDHGDDEPVDDPGVGAARPRRAPRIVDLDGFDRGVGAERLLVRVQEDLRPVPPRPEPADPQEAVADRQLLAAGRIADLEFERKIAVGKGFDV